MQKRELLRIPNTRTAKNNNNRSPTKHQEDEKSRYNISWLPEHIIRDIFSKLSITSVFQCRRVCKTWRRLLSDPEVTKTLISPTLSCLLINGSSNLHDTFLLDLNNHNDVVVGGVARLTSGRKEQIVGSCNGLLCMFHDYFLGKFSVSNPLTGEQVWLDSADARFDRWGFGYSPISNVYKIVLFQSSFKSVFTVMTVGSGIWRSVEYTGGLLREYVCLDGSDWIYLNGFLHCICAHNEHRNRFYGRLLSILAFDIENEIFHWLSLPDEFDDGKLVGVELGVLDGKLSVTIARNKEMVVWVMKDYGDEDSWTEELEIRDNHHKLRVFKLLNYAQGRALMLCGHLLYTYTPGTYRGLVRVQVDSKVPPIQKAWVHFPSALSLKDVIGGDQS